MGGQLKWLGKRYRYDVRLSSTTGKQLMRQFLVFALVCVLSACTKVGRPISHAERDQITEGVTTREELLNRLGPPALLSKDGNGNDMVTWVYVRSAFFRGRL